ncbi:MAG: DUF2339 domain-containing protein, partial [Candidatus Omnitrophica bacterium]|nr:DUF2339 domain-containing protein [Candidatus Omnitrophota bacterium]
MKRCGSCGKTYDDSWKVCLECRVELSGGMEEDIREIRSAISSLSRRVDILESALKGEKPGEAPAFEKKSCSRPREVFDAAAKPDFSIFRDNEQASTPHKKEKASIVGSFSLFKEEKGWKKTSISWNIEQMLGEKWFNKLGVFAVVIGVALLIGYSFKYLGPAAKIGIGYAFGLGLLGYGVFIEKKKDLSVFGRSLVAGGWAINYFTTFAMHHIPEVRLVASPVAGMALLVAVSAAAIAHIYRYRSEVATSFSYLLMFITLMITPVSLYTMSASILVAVSLIYFMYKMKWNSFAIYGMIMSYLSYVAFLARSPKVEIQFAHFAVITAYLGIYWLIFVIAGSLMKNDGEENEAISRKDFIFLLNSS